MKSQNEAVRVALCNGQKLSALNAFKMTGSMRIGARIFDMTEEGFVFKKEEKKIKTRFGTRCKYIEYSIDFENTPKELIEKYSGIKTKKEEQSDSLSLF